MSWIAVVLTVPAVLEDEIAARLGAGRLGVEIVEESSTTRRLRVVLAATDDPGRALDEAATVLRGFGLDGDAWGPRLERIEDGAWVETYQASLRPQPLGERFVVLPGGEDDRDRSERIPIRLVPGRAFGTGEHETTRLCAAELERRVVVGSRWLDLGTGSGILAVVAARCGAAEVIGLDIDPLAIETAREVVAMNGVADRVEIVEGSVDAARGRFDGVVANVTSSFFLRAAREIASPVVAGGWLLASGFLDDDLDGVLDAFRAARLRPAAVEADGPWRLVAARREI